MRDIRAKDGAFRSQVVDLIRSLTPEDLPPLAQIMDIRAFADIQRALSGAPTTGPEPEPSETS